MRCNAARSIQKNCTRIFIILIVTPFLFFPHYWNYRIIVFMFRIRFSFRFYTARIVRLINGTSIISVWLNGISYSFNKQYIKLNFNRELKKIVEKVIKRMPNIFTAMSERIRSDNNSICYKKAITVWEGKIEKKNFFIYCIGSNLFSTNFSRTRFNLYSVFNRQKKF